MNLFEGEGLFPNPKRTYKLFHTLKQN